jgi:Zn-dependent membrane protease YugP
MHLLVIILFVLFIIFAPQWWAKHVFKRFSKQQDHIQGTGGELAKHLLERFDMTEVTVEETQEGNDHYDPESKTVRLSPNNFNDKSLTAVAVASHEVGHAIQHHRNETKLAVRTRLVKTSIKLEKAGSVIMMVMPIVLIITRSPIAGLIFFATGLLSIAGSSLIHLVTLPVEWDASFGKALPILKEGYVREQDYAAVNTILKAAAFTYIAASLTSLLSVWRWVALLRR